MTLAIAQTPGGTATRSHTVNGEEVPAVAQVNALSMYHDVVDASTNAATIKGSAGYVYGMSVFNAAAYTIFVKLFDVAGVPVPGTDTVARTYAVPPGMARDVAEQGGLTFANGIGIAITKLMADNDTTPVSANDCVVDVSYR
jgi:hypothetical protein